MNLFGILESANKVATACKPISRQWPLLLISGRGPTGQTGSGKTFTITGGTERYADRCVAPSLPSVRLSKWDRQGWFAISFIGGCVMVLTSEQIVGSHHPRPQRYHPASSQPHLQRDCEANRLQVRALRLPAAPPSASARPGRSSQYGRLSADARSSCPNLTRCRSYTVHISYLEIYNDSGYDLLDPAHETTLMEDLPKARTHTCLLAPLTIASPSCRFFNAADARRSERRYLLALCQVTIQEREDGQIHCRGLLKHPAANEEDALNLLFLVRAFSPPSAIHCRHSSGSALSPLRAEETSELT